MTELGQASQFSLDQIRRAILMCFMRIDMLRLIKGDAYNLDLRFEEEDFWDHLNIALNRLDPEEAIDFVDFNTANPSFVRDNFFDEVYPLHGRKLKPIYPDDLTALLWNIFPDNSKSLKKIGCVDVKPVRKDQIRDFLLSDIELAGIRENTTKGVALNRNSLINYRQLKRCLENCVVWLRRTFRIRISMDELNEEGLVAKRYFKPAMWEKAFILLRSSLKLKFDPLLEIECLYLDTLVAAVWQLVPPENRAED